MIIVGIMGGIGHGKTTFAEALHRAQPKSRHIENSELISEIINNWQSQTTFIPNPAKSDDVKKWLQLLPGAFEKATHQSIDRNIFAFDPEIANKHPILYEKLYTYLLDVQKKPALLSTPITVGNKSEYRAILQWLGGYVQVKLPPGFWFRELIHRVKQFEMQGVELGILGGVRFPADVDVIKGADGYVLLIQRSLSREMDANDPTEAARKLITPDTTIHNDAGIAELIGCAKKVYDNLQNAELKQEYFASTSAN
ncbi:MAG TPA: hypothetical protein VLG47_00895 [Candidatus Saccharimonadales bacterium]|nr:hypothetical protein [Candidatus Saccharimonadales bacterium]